MDLRSRNKVDPNFSMSSMTDIVFLLLIFFLLTSTMVPSNVLELKLPKADGETLQQEQVVVSINNEGVFFLGEREIPKQQLELELNQALEGVEEASFVLQAEENTYTKDIVYVMDVANKNRYKMVLATQPADE
ncbi:MAG: biopolymer transporter ExbD [Flavobacteriaceae bacterium]|nr:biopolymer transporter ExbD [Flavobacteriaceae bacterium]